LQVFEVKKSIETVRLNGNTIGEVLSDKNVYLIIDESEKRIVIYKGLKSNLVNYFIALKLAKEYQQILKGIFSIQHLEEENLGEFKNREITNSSDIPILVNPDLVPIEKTEDTADSSETIKLPELKEGQYINTDPAWKERFTSEDLPIFDNPNINSIFKKLKSSTQPQDYSSEMIFIGSTVYKKSRVDSGFLHRKKTETKIIKLGQLPEGNFFQSGVSTQLYIQNGRIQSIELFRKRSKERANLQGVIKAPVLFIPRITHERSIDVLQKSFNMPPKTSVEELEANMNK
jgi:hypothetical protein